MKLIFHDLAWWLEKVAVKSQTRHGGPRGRRSAHFCSMKQLGIWLLPNGWDASPLQGYPQHYVAGTHLYTWAERKCRAQFPFLGNSTTLKTKA